MQLKQIVADWLNDLGKSENSVLRQQAFAVAEWGTESCVDRASYYFNQMYSLMVEHRLIQNNVPIADAFYAILGLFRMQQLEEIAAEQATYRRRDDPHFDEDLEIYLAYQYGLREKLSLPIYTELQFENIAKLTEENIDSAKEQLLAAEKQKFLRYLVTESSCWNDMLEKWDKTKKNAVTEHYLETISADSFKRKIDSLLKENNIDIDDEDARRAISKKTADDLLFQQQYQLTQEFLTAHHALFLIEQFTYH